jgi:hypothetical protein
MSSKLEKQTLRAMLTEGFGEMMRNRTALDYYVEGREGKERRVAGGKLTFIQVVSLVLVWWVIDITSSLSEVRGRPTVADGHVLCGCDADPSALIP